jgi:hypothetical protein
MKRLLCITAVFAVALCGAAVFGEDAPAAKIEIVTPKTQANDTYSKLPGVVKFKEILAVEQQGEADKALEGYRAYVKEFKDQPVPHYYIAKILITKDDKDGALAAIAVADKTNAG